MDMGRRKIDLSNLTLVKGRSYEGILKILKENGIDYKIDYWPCCRESYFRDSSIEVHPAHSGKIDKLLGRGEIGVCSTTYYARYDINEGFNRKQLDGPVIHKRGLLVERVQIQFKEPTQSTPTVF